MVNQPYVGHVSPNHPGGDVLEWNIPNTSYTLPYMVNDKHIVIMRVFDQRQRRPASWG
ncbi:MAG: hypothetical protein H6981_14660 [Gammaproteobacteria bacterium]|nr:hypothetical protein [Gammaproteobacteria bacterium]MCP5138025.1 hypothetical protein [Gammaproteobacteria bacterium]